MSKAVSLFMGQDIHRMMEELIGKVQGVISCRIVPDSHGGMAEVHVLTDEKRVPKQVVRDIETVLLTRLGIKIDHKKISVAQFGTEKEAEGQRICFEGISFRTNHTTAEVTITLSYAGRRFEEKAEGVNSRENHLRLVAFATAKTLRQFFGETTELVVDGVMVGNFAGREMIVVGVTILAHGREENLLGAAYVRGDMKESTARATLDAVNRLCQRHM